MPDGVIRNTPPKHVQQPEIAMFRMHARAPELDYLRAVAFVRPKTKFPLTIIPSVRRRDLARLQPICSDDFAVRHIFDDQVIADLVEWIDVKPCDMRFRQAFVEFAEEMVQRIKTM